MEDKANNTDFGGGVRKTILRGVISERFLLEALSRYSAYTPLRGHWRWIRWVAALLLTLNGVYQVVSQDFSLGIFLISAGSMMAIAPLLQRYSVIRRLRRSPFYLQECTQVVTEDGVLTETPSSKAELKWTSFSSARLAADGVLLMQGQGVFYWMPASRIESGSLEELWAIIPQHLKNKRV